MLKKIAPDKWKHFYVGIAMGAVLQLAGHYWLPQHPVRAIAFVLFIVISISYGFELFSKLSGIGIYDIMDAVASIAGGAIGMAFIIAIFVLLH